MKKLCRIIFFSVVILCLFGCKKQVDYSTNEILATSFEENARLVDEYLTNSKFQGVVLIGHKSNVLYAKGFGVCDKKSSKKNPITIHSVFEIGSVTKQMTAAAIMQLAEKKKLSVNDKISKYFPDYQYGNQITIEMLLRMRSGIVDYVNAMDDFFPKNVCHQIERAYYSGKSIEENFVLKYLNDVPLMFTPDSTYFYSNTNYYLLGKIIEQVSGQSYNDYIQKNIFDVCGMSESNLIPGKIDTRGYDWKKRSYYIPKEFVFACGDVNSTVIDLFKWNNALMNGKVVSKKSFKQMVKTNSYGYGLNCQNGEVFHSGVTGVFNSYLTTYKENGIVIAVLINRPISECNATNISREIYKILDKSELKK